MVPTEIFRARALLQWKGAIDVQETDDAYVLRWSENRSVKIDFTLLVNKETYAPLRFSDHSSGKDYKGKPFDQTYSEDSRSTRSSPTPPRTVSCWSSSSAGPRGRTRGPRRSR